MTVLDPNNPAVPAVRPETTVSPYSTPPVLGTFFTPPQGPITLRRFLFGLFAGLIVLGAVTALDLITGPRIYLGPVYLFAIVVAAWFGGRWAGHLINCITTAVWMWTVVLQAPNFIAQPLNVFDSARNVLIRLVFFGIITEILVMLHGIERRLEQVVEDRTASLRQEVLERQRAEASLRALAAQLSAAEDVERRRIAYDIHDALSQMLGLVKLNLETTVAETAIDSRQYTRLNDVVRIVDDLIRQTRELTFELHPSMLDHFGLVPTLEQFAEDYGRQVSAEISVNEVGHGVKIRSDLSSYLFRAVKEVLSNSVRHGNASQIVVNFHWSHEGLRVVVDDDGSGFDPETALLPQARRGLGLAGIAERLTSLGGKLRLESQPGTGTRVIMEVPLETDQG